MPYRDLRGFLSDLTAREDLVEVDEPVDPILEVTALARRVQAAKGPALLMNNPAGSGHPLLLNLFGHRRRIEAVLGGRPISRLEELGELLARLQQPRLPRSLKSALSDWPELGQIALMAPKRVEHGVFRDNVLKDGDIDLEQLPIQQCWPGDAGRLITLGLVITHNARLGRQNIGIYRQQLIGRNRVIMRWLAHRGGAQDFAEWQQNHPDKPFPLAVAIGADPATTLAAVSPVPDTLSEMQFAGLLRGARSEVVRASLSGLEVPAGTEILLEGHIHPGDTAIEGPFGDHTGHYNARGRYPVFTVERVSLRDGAIYQGSFMGQSPHDEPSILASALNDLFVPILRGIFPEVRDFYLPPAACSYRIALVSIDKRYPGHARRMMMGVWSYLRQFTYTKFVIVFDADIDIRDGNEVLWAIANHVDPGRDSMLVERTPVDALDFAGPEPGLGSKLGLDATRKWPAETTRAWPDAIVPDPEVEKRVEALMQSIPGLAGIG
ncbi:MULTISPECIES: UbiD family decarboxylase [unclassified Wenzhouxiangella]|uniref:UbiD family decarboxylase n=1 Tax=unclassified Wenzhouxiangella TaxID=2613841 RepID=UPI000E32C2C0|nr:MULTISPECIES: UbiD family decarboxylase [unclassified Wenzhouxiangella]RFF27351.1 UbiD family decarboxylase [Wenzhouxiangella sp. 15181]RFP68781.1 UbiD family decarboxylase [Wenzhouxiangella sp. 15190]